MPFLLDVAFIWISTALLYRYRKNISAKLRTIPLPTWILSSIVLLALIVIEESVNCIDYGDGLGCRMTTWINVVLFIYVTVGTFILRHIAISYKKSLIILSMLGVLWEVTIGGLTQLPFGLFYLVMLVHVFCSYAFLAIIPLHLIKR